MKRWKDAAKVSIRHVQTIAFPCIPDNKNIYNKLLENRAEIEKTLDAAVEWRNAKKASRFLISKSIDINNPTNWDEACNWLMDICLKVKYVTNKFNK